jgi:hypothetical protein
VITALEHIEKAITGNYGTVIDDRATTTKNEG